VRSTTAGAIVALALSFGIARSAAANPRVLPFSYPYETLTKGTFEMEQFVDATPSVALSTSTGQPASLLLFNFTTEFEYGITDRLELGLYFQIAPSPGDGFSGAGAIDFSGAKQRLRYRIGREGLLPLEISVYGELTETEREIEIEAKLNLQKRFGNFRLISNLWAEYEIYFDGRREWVLNPTLGATYEVNPMFSAGVESWMRVEFPDPTPTVPRVFALGPHAFVGPTAMVNFGKLWWSAGLYFRVTDTARAVAPGDTFGRIWVRSVVGLDI